MDTLKREREAEDVLEANPLMKTGVIRATSPVTTLMPMDGKMIDFLLIGPLLMVLHVLQ